MYVDVDDVQENREYGSVCQILVGWSLRKGGLGGLQGSGHRLPSWVNYCADSKVLLPG